MGYNGLQWVKLARVSVYICLYKLAFISHLSYIITITDVTVSYAYFVNKSLSSIVEQVNNCMVLNIRFENWQLYAGIDLNGK